MRPSNPLNPAGNIEKNILRDPVIDYDDARQRAEQSRYRRAGQRQPHRPHARRMSRADAVDKRNADQRAYEGERNQARDADPGKKDEPRGEQQSCPRIESHQGRACQRIAGHALHDCACDREACTNQRRSNGAGQTQIVNDEMFRIGRIEPEQGV